MFIPTEPNLQNWRALAVFDDGSDGLLYVGRSTTQVRAGYGAAFADVLDDAERARVRCVSLQRWQGVADRGCWVAQAVLPVPPRPRGTEAA